MFGIDDLLMGGLSSLGQFMGWQQQQSFDSSQIANMEAFQERMSNTAYSRRAHDLSDAGINPILAVSSGAASVPSGGAASTQATDVVSPGLNTAMQSARFKQDMQTAVYQNEQQRNDIQIKAETANNVAQDTRLKAAKTAGALLQNRSDAPDATRGDIDNAVLKNSAVAGARALSTGVAEGARGVESAASAILPWKSSARADRRSRYMYGE